MIIRYYNCKDDRLMLNKTLEFVDAKTCNIFGVCDMRHLNLVSDSKPVGNYASFDNKCYFVESYSYANGKWLIHCTLDTLYTNRNEIRALNVLVARSEERSADIVDSCIPFRKNDYVTTRTFGKSIIANGTRCFVVGVI